MLSENRLRTIIRCASARARVQAGMAASRCASEQSHSGLDRTPVGAASWRGPEVPHLHTALDSGSISSGWGFLPGSVSDLLANRWLESRTFCSSEIRIGMGPPS